MQEIGQVILYLFVRGITPIAVLVQWESRDAKKLQTELAWQAARSRNYSREEWLSRILLKFKMRQLSLRSAMFRSSFTLSADRRRVALCSLAARLETRMRG